MSPNTYAFIQLLWIAAAVWWLIKRQDELPLIIAGFLYYVFSFRLWILLQGLASPSNLSPFGFEGLSIESAIEVLRLAVLGESVMLGVYMAFQRMSLAGAVSALSPAQGRWMRAFVFALVLVIVPVLLFAQAIVRSEVEGGKSLAFEVSNYLYLFPFVLSSVAILVAAIWKAGQLPTGMHKVAAVVLFVFIARWTFNPTARFQFLGWVIAVTIIFCSGTGLWRRIAVACAGLAVATTLFAVAGALRGTDELVETELQQSAWERFAFAQDANMLDGFAFLMQVYPERLNYTYGREHFDIFLRPIPRSLWPGKPVGGYINKLGLMDASSGFTLGISPSLFGSFYQEGGWIGLILLSAIYAFVMARLVVFSRQIHPFSGTLIRALLIAWLIPLLRGGDLPGNYAWFGMAFWPCLLVLWLKRRELLVKHVEVGHGTDQLDSAGSRNIVFAGDVRKA